MNELEGQKNFRCAPGEALFRVRDLYRSFFLEGKEIRVLKGVTMDIRCQEALAIVGASGVGKTTLLHVLGALDHATEGVVLYQEEDLLSKSENELALFRNRDIGYVFQFHYLLAELSALENVALPALIGGIPKKEAQERAGTLLEELGLVERLKHRPGRLSGGEQQRVAIARAMIMKPQVILADEPTGNLDTKTGASVEEALLSMRQNYGVTLVTVTHNPRFASRMDRELHMIDGRMVETDTTSRENNG